MQSRPHDDRSEPHARHEVVSPMLEWLIIGGGIHGTYLSLVLTTRAGIPRDRVRVLDPHPQPLACWSARAVNTGMTHLRSPDVHNLDLDPLSLFHSARRCAEPPETCFAGIYRNQPSFSFFQRHAMWVMQQYRLADLRIVGRAERIARGAGGLRVETADGALEARRVLLAIGPSDPYRPEWARPLSTQPVPLHHVFDSDFQRTTLPPWTHAVIIGGGITAAQTALALAHRAPGTVTLVSRHPFREYPFDSDPCWFSSCLIPFGREASLARRRALIDRARHRGSIPPDVLQQLRTAVTRRALAAQFATVQQAFVRPDGHLALTIGNDDGAQTIIADRVILATGFAQERPGGQWLTRTIAELELACSACGYPITDRTLCWHPAGLYVTGALAELELGPAARNIIGARLAAERIMAVAAAEYRSASSL
ncbi:MAG: FAD/NAD(P)-binding protein [Candidatus Binatia bacterium]|nr:FAD/NAD(P)-binding protein [Candidatus Binatia bacterium]